jgi:hypothetical protein
MTKLRTLALLQDALDEDMGWRIKEISDLRIATKKQTESARTFVRAGVALVYAHWEGFIKTASENYLNYVNNQGHTYRDLKTCFGVFGLKGRLALLGHSRQTKQNVEALNFILAEMDKPAKVDMASAIDTEANLNSKVFANIANSLDISITPYETKFNLIDESLLKRRNRVAHGEYLDLQPTEFYVLSDEVLQMMRSYKTDIQNAATSKSYKR